MKCPFCVHQDDKVIDSRSASDGRAVRRRRECGRCERRFTTYEEVEEMSLYVAKKDGRREPFDRKKILAGIQKACEKRPVSSPKIESIVASIEQQVFRKFEKEVPTKFIGELIMDKLAATDEGSLHGGSILFRDLSE